MLQIAQACQFHALEEQCLGLAADKLATLGGHWAGVVREDELAALDSATLARLLGKTLQSGEGGQHPAQHVFDVQHPTTTAGGFIFAIPGFSKQPDTVYSLWVEIGGFEWRLTVYPGGCGEGRGTPLSGEWWQ